MANRQTAGLGVRVSGDVVVEMLGLLFVVLMGMELQV